MESVNFKQSTADPCIFVIAEETGETAIVAVYVDDLITSPRQIRKKKETKKRLNQGSR